MANLVRISELDSKVKSFPLKASTLYKWHAAGDQYPELFIKIAGTVFVDLDEWENIVRRTKTAAIEAIARNEPSQPEVDPS